MMIEETMTLEEKMAHWVELRDKCNLNAGLEALHAVIEKDIEVFNGLESRLKNNLVYSSVLDTVANTIEIYQGASALNRKLILKSDSIEVHTVGYSSNPEFIIKQRWNEDTLECDYKIKIGSVWFVKSLQAISQKCLIDVFFKN